MKKLRRLSLLTREKQLISKEFQELIHKKKDDVVFWWKTHYGYSSNDRRYLTATKEQMYNDFLDKKVESYIDDYRENPERERIERGRLLDPEFDKKENEDFKKLLSNIEVIDLNE